MLPIPPDVKHNFLCEVVKLFHFILVSIVIVLVFVARFPFVDAEIQEKYQRPPRQLGCLGKRTLQELASDLVQVGFQFGGPEMRCPTLGPFVADFPGFGVFLFRGLENRCGDPLSDAVRSCEQFLLHSSPGGLILQSTMHERFQIIG
ncbi:hypothetical protein PG996_012583 [Apiospora saccharicola]|uniref:Uncharacterized protein n=1 Tax=Apiospora saccharicola TaxID=335842 RepID=A0ABR1U300_9PEZI